MENKKYPKQKHIPTDRTVKDRAKDYVEKTLQSTDRYTLRQVHTRLVNSAPNSPKRPAKTTITRTMSMKTLTDFLNKSKDDKNKKGAKKIPEKEKSAELQEQKDKDRKQQEEDSRSNEQEWQDDDIFSETAENVKLRGQDSGTKRGPSTSPEDGMKKKDSKLEKQNEGKKQYDKEKDEKDRKEKEIQKREWEERVRIAKEKKEHEENHRKQLEKEQEEKERQAREQQVKRWNEMRQQEQEKQKEQERQAEENRKGEKEKESNLNKNIGAVLDSLSEMKSTIYAWDKKLSDSKSDIVQTVMTLNDENKNEFRRVHEQIIRMEEIIQGNKREMTEIKNRVVMTENEQGNLNKKLDRIESEIRESRQSVDTIDRKNKEIEKKVEETRKTVMEVQDKEPETEQNKRERKKQENMKDSQTGLMIVNIDELKGKFKLTGNDDPSKMVAALLKHIDMYYYMTRNYPIYGKEESRTQAKTVVIHFITPQCKQDAAAKIVQMLIKEQYKNVQLRDVFAPEIKEEVHEVLRVGKEIKKRGKIDKWKVINRNGKPVLQAIKKKGEWYRDQKIAEWQGILREEDKQTDERQKDYEQNQTRQDRNNGQENNDVPLHGY